MINVKFWGVSFYPSGYINENTFEGRLKTEPDYAMPVSTSWKNESYPIQTVIYPQYSFTIYQKETFFTGFEKIKYAAQIRILYNGTTYTCKLTDYKDSLIVDSKGFKSVEIFVADLTNKKIVNTYNYMNQLYVMNIRNAANTILFTTPIYFDYQLNPVLTENIVDNFKDIVTDYRKKTDIYVFRVIISAINLSSFYTALMGVSVNTDKNKIQITPIGTTFRQYEEANKTEIGQDLYQIDMKLILSNTIVTQWN